MYYISGLSAGRAIQRERHCRVRPSSLCLGTLHHDLHLWHWQLDHRLEKITLEIIQKTHLPGLVNIQKTMERSTIFKFGKSTISMCHFQQLCNKLPEGILSYPLLFSPICLTGLQLISMFMNNLLPGMHVQAWQLGGCQVADILTWLMQIRDQSKSGVIPTQYHSNLQNDRDVFYIILVCVSTVLRGL